MVNYNKNLTKRSIRRFCPDEYVKSVADIDIQSLKAKGIKAIGLDMDNTLTKWKSVDLTDDVALWLEKVHSSGIKSCLVSNSRRLKRLTSVSEKLKIPFVKGPMKPCRAKFLAAFELLGVKPNEFAMIGDQMFTDIWGGNRAGTYTIMVEPIDINFEFFGTKITRGFERMLLSKFAKQEYK